MNRSASVDLPVVIWAKMQKFSRKRESLDIVSRCIRNPGSDAFGRFESEQFPDLQIVERLVPTRLGDLVKQSRVR
jgi:hypothetical protein